MKKFAYLVADGLSIACLACVVASAIVCVASSDAHLAKSACALGFLTGLAGLALENWIRK